MKLKRLEMIGFKSFVDKTVVNFEKDITGVVGPNGCGKSNIVDAIRWVMGEQSPKHLRGKSMEDVIFAGSDARQPLSMASVELTFSTAGYQTPAHYLNQDEISICRRVYRSGESEYFINKAVSRLRDIQDLFLGTGVGTKAYSIIEQGRVSQFLTAKPEERRYYIEEAAGVSRFKSKKEAALRKMEATRQNLLRLTDLITELERQIASLDRQAKKAEKYKEIKTEFQKWDLSLFSYLYKNGYQSQQVLESNLGTYTEQEALAQASLLESEMKLEEARLNAASKEQQINQVQTSLFEMTNNLQLAEADFRYKGEELSRLVVTLEELAKNAELYVLQLAEVEEKLLGIHEEKQQSETETQRLLEEVARLDALVSSSQLRVDELRVVIESAKESAFQSERRLTQIASLKEAAIHKKEELLTQCLGHEEELEKNRSVLQQTQKLYRESVEFLESIKQMRLDLDQQNDKLSEDLDSLKRHLVDEEKALSEVRDQLTLRRSRLSSLEQLQKNFEGYAEGTRQVLKRKQETNQEGVFGTVADFIETEPQYENAVSAVLGEKLQYVIVKSQSEGLEAVDYLRSAASGRSSFIPMTTQYVGEPEAQVPLQQGVLGPLKSFVNLRQEYSHLADYLFGDIFLVEDLQRAIDVWSSASQRKTLVTLGGEVVDPNGVITGGSLSGQSQTLLAMKREIKELGQLIEKLEYDVREKENTRLDLVHRVESLTHSLEEVKKSAHEESVKLASQGKDVDQIKKEIDTLTSRQNHLSHQVQQLQASQLRQTEAIEQLSSEEAELTQKMQEFALDMERNKQELGDILSSTQTHTEALTKAKVDMAQAQERYLRIQSDIKRWSDDQQRLQQAERQLLEQRDSGFRRQEELLAARASLEQVIAQRKEDRAEFEKTLADERSAYENINTQIRETELILRELRKNYEDATRQVSQITVQLTEVRGRLKMWIEQCQERHQLVLPEIVETYFDEALNLSEAESKSTELREKLARMGEVNTGALAEYEELKVRYDFLKTQNDDLQQSLDTLEKVIQKINKTSRERFLVTFNQVNEKFQLLFPKLFRGGRAKMMLTDENNLAETGVDIMAQPPGKKQQSISLLSGGEKALTAVSLIFSIFQIKPSPFCILDEVDAPLDEANVGRYNELLREMTPQTQFIVITHNKKTMSLTDTLYGVTMQEPGASQLVSVELK